MFKLIRLLIALAFSLAMSASFAAAADLTTAEKASLQAGMQQHIDRNLVEGAYLRLDLATGGVSKLHPVTAHPMILRLGQYYVLCSDFRDDKGAAVNVDFYMASRGKSFVVFDTVVDHRAELEKLMKDGKASMVK
ncbi:MAG: hypothetical protein ABI589_14230 [Burkholderiales bacterium]